MAEILFVRHGQASFGADDYDCLSDLGEHQTDLTGQYLAGSGISLKAIYQGDLQRQRQTADAIAANYSWSIPRIVEPGFNELDTEQQLDCLLPKLIRNHSELAALLEGGMRSKKNFQKILKIVFNHWVLDKPEVAGLESWSAFSQRIASSVQRVMAEQGASSTTLVSTSGGVIAAVVQQVLGVRDEKVYSLFEAVYNASITRLIYNSRGDVALSYFNDCSYLRSRDEGLVSYR